VKGNVILSTDKVKELSRRYSDKIENDLYDEDREMRYTINDMEDEINALINYFERNIGNCINLHESLLNSEENKQRIIETVQKVEESIKLVKGRLNNE
jgi:aminopeptidase-like protein